MDSTAINVVERFRSAEVEYRLELARGMVKHRGEGEEIIVSALALLDCESQYREFLEATAAFEVWRETQTERILASHDAAAAYHLSWATRENA